MCENRKHRNGAKVQFQQRRRKVLNAFSFHPSNIAALHPANFHNHMDPEHDWDRPKKSNALKRIEVLLSIFPLAPSK